MTLKQWQETKSATEWMSKVLASEQGRQFLETLEESHPRHYQRTDDAVGLAVELSKIYGYDQCINTIKAMRHLAVPEHELEATWGAEQSAQVPIWKADAPTPQTVPKSASELE